MKIQSVRADDWETVYINGRLATSGHGTDWKEIVELLGFDVESYYTEDEAFETYCYEVRWDQVEANVKLQK